jgi:hypothetical protein
LLQFEVAEILLYDVRHSHAERRSEVLRSHLLLFFRILEKSEQAVRQVLSVPGLIELDRQFFSFRHLPEVCEVGADDGDAVGAGQMSDPAAARG